MRENRSVSRSSAPASRSRGGVIAAVVLAAVGGILLLNNFYFLDGFDVGALWPLIFVVLGGLILLRGDFPASTAGRSFGITRGSVEAAVLEVHAGEIDVRGRALPREGRLIAGQYASEGRPQLTVDEGRAVLKFDRAATPWLSFADWDLGLARDLPWAIAISTSLGAVQLDLSGLIVQRAQIATGIGDVQITIPQEAFEPLELRSALGSLHVLTPPGANVEIHVQPTRLFRVYHDARRYEQHENGIYTARAADLKQRPMVVRLHGTFGDAYLA